MAIQKKELTIEEISGDNFFSVSFLENYLGWSRGFVEGILEQKGYSFYTLFGKNLIVAKKELREAMVSLNLSTALLDKK